MDEVRGSAPGIRELARHWVQQGEAADSAAVTLGSAKNNIEGGTLRLKGDFAPKLRDAIGDLPGELQKLARGYHGCGQALDRYATVLEQAQQKYRRARQDSDVAARNQRNAEYDLDTLAPGWDAHAQSPTGLRAYLADQPEPVLTAVSRRESAQHDADLAASLARQAAALRGEGEKTCVHEIKDALSDSGLKNRTWYQKVGNYLKESFTTWDGFVKLCENVSLVLGVVALFLTGPLALVVGAVLLVAAAVAVADKIKKLADGEIGWGDLAFELGMVVLARFGGRALGPAFRRLATSKAVKGLSSQVHKGADRLADRLKLGDRARNLAHRGICTVTGHPIDVATGKMFTESVDLELPGPLPFVQHRIWYSTSTYAGPFGHGWHHAYDAALYATGDALLYRTPDGRLVDLMPLYPGTTYFDRPERITVSRDESGYRIRTTDGVTSRFAPPPGPSSADPEVPVVHLLRDLVGRSGHRISLEYDDERGALTRIVDSAGREVGLRHDERGRVVELTAPHPEHEDERTTVARYGYDELGNLVSMRDALDQEFRYRYDGHLMVEETDRTGLAFHFEYDGTNERARCTHTWGDGGIYDHRLSYRPGVTTVLDSLGHATEHEHEGGLVIRTVDPLGARTRVEFEYQQPVRRTDALGRVTTFGYDYRGNQIELRTPDGAITRSAFDARDLPVSAVDPVGGTWAWNYDDAGLLTEAIDPLGAVTRFDYRSGLLSERTDPAGVTVIEHDEQGGLAAVRTPDGFGHRWRRNRWGWATTVIDTLGNEQRLRYDRAGRVIEVQEPDGETRRMTYDGEGNLLSSTDALTQVEFGYRGLGRLATRSQAGTTVRFDYDTEERLTGIVNEHGRVHGFERGPTGQIVGERGFGELIRLYERDAHGRIASVRRPSGLVDRYEYDGADRPIAVTHSDGTGTRFRYGPGGDLQSAENATGTVHFERDVLGRVIRESQGEHWVASAYDEFGSRTAIRSSLGADQVIDRGPSGDVTGVGADGADGYRVRFTRDALGRELTRELPGGLESRWQRDRLGRPVRHRIGGAQGSDRTDRDRQYDWAGTNRLRGVIDALAGPIGYQHDELAQLTAATYPQGRVDLRMPDAVGNLFRTADRSDREYGPAGELLRSTDAEGRPVRYRYDPEGNLVSKAGSGGTWSYRWDAEGNLVEVTRPDDAVVAFAYDPLGRRTGKSFRGRTTRWIWDGDVPLHEWVDEPPEHGPAADPITWLFEPDGFAPLACAVGGRYQSIVTDLLGSPVAMYADDGTLTWAADLSVWGDPEVTTGDRGAVPFRWPGQYEDAETGLYYNRFRYYDPESGRYTSPDPSGLVGGLALYGYVHDPVTWADPHGLKGKPRGLARFGNLNDDELARSTDEMLFRDKRSQANQGTHGLVHRFEEQVHGANRPGTKSWDDHDTGYHNQQLGVIDRLYEMERRGMEVPSRAWKIATTSRPTGNQRRIPGCMS